MKKHGQRYWVQGSFASETLTLSEGADMIAAARENVDIPIIASVGVLEPETNAPIETAMRLIEAGAQLVHFDLFYLPQPRSSDTMIEMLRNLFSRARAHLAVPFGPKLNSDIPAHRFALAIDPGTIDVLFFLDSVRVPPPIDSSGSPLISAWRGGLECSLFGSDWQKPLSLQYTRVLADAQMPELCAGGGLRNADDIIEAIMLGATTTQVATQLIIQGYDWITRTNDDLQRKLEAAGCTSLAGLRAGALRLRDQNSVEEVEPVRAIVDAQLCRPCGVCTKLVFCSFIRGEPGDTPTISDGCYGCGMCAEICPMPGAIRMEAIP